MAFNPTSSNFGSINGGADAEALFLKMFGGEVITAYRKDTKFVERHKVKTITSGKSAQFPKSGNLTDAADYLVRGQTVPTEALDHNQEVIEIDGQLTKAVLLTDQDEAFTHWPTRQEHAFQMGQSIGQTWDRNVAIQGILGARAANSVNGLPGGGEITNASAKTDSNELYDALYQARRTLDEKYVNDDASAFLRPFEYHLLLQADKLINRDFTSMDNGGVDRGVVNAIAGMQIVKTNNLPNANISGTVDGKYDVDATNVAALVMTPDSVGTVKLKELATKMSYENAYQGTLMVSSVMMGTKWIRPEGLVEINTVANA